MWRVQTVHYGTEIGAGAWYAEQWMALDASSDCGTVGKVEVYWHKSDVSKRDRGVRCKGACSIAPVSSHYSRVCCDQKQEAHSVLI